MINVVYLVIFVMSNNGVTSQSIPQANMAQCQANAKIYNTGKNNGIVHNGWMDSVKTQAAHCIVGVK
jgi:hypothetical protein